MGLNGRRICLRDTSQRSNRLCPRVPRSVQNLLHGIGIRDRGFERKCLLTTILHHYRSRQAVLSVVLVNRPENRYTRHSSYGWLPLAYFSNPVLMVSTQSSPPPFNLRELQVRQD